MNPDHYRALKETTGVVRRVDRGRIAVTGADRADYLQGLLTNDILALDDGWGCYAAYLTPQGRIIADVELFNLGDKLLLDVHGSVKDMLVQRLDELVFAEDVDVVDWSEGWVGFTIVGPTAEQCLASVLAESSSVVGGGVIPKAFDDHECRLLLRMGTSLVVSRTDPFGAMGFDLWVERSGALELWNRLIEVGCTEVDAAATDVVRIENGRPGFPADLNVEIIPLEAGIEDRAVSFTKGCYVGQEVIVRVLHRGRGRVSRKLTGLTMHQLVDPPPLSAGAPLWHDNEVVGEMTSAGFSPAAGAVLGLGYVKRDWLEPGTLLEVTTGLSRVPAVVTALPFAF
jgi:folate-binding protein YgfZ